MNRMSLFLMVLIHTRVFCFPATLPDVSCRVGELDFINPNGYFNIIQVLQSIGIKAGIQQYGCGTKEWMFVECDGLPYNLIRDIIANVFRYSECKTCFYSIQNFIEHMCHVKRKLEAKREFGWLVQVFGLLHFEMNVARAFIKLNWEVFVGSLGKVLGFVSPKAQEYLKKEI